MNACEAYEYVSHLIKNKRLVIRDYNYFGLVAIKSKRRYLGLEFYINRGTLALLKLIQQGFTCNDVINLLVKEGFPKEQSEEIILEHLKPFILDPREFREGESIEYYHPINDPYPHVLIWEVTWRCNLRCIYCFANAGDTPINYRELNYNEIKNLVDKLHGTVTYIFLSGGEPTLYPYFLDLLRLLNEKDFIIILSTNGILLSKKPELIKKVAELVDEVHIPLDGSKPEIHNTLRGGYAEAVMTLQELVKLNGPLVAVDTVVTKLNYDDIGNIIDFCANLGVDAWLWGPMAPIGRGFAKKDLMLSPHELIALHEYLTRKAKEYRNILHIQTFVDWVTPLKMARPTLRCAAATYYLLMAPNGDIYPCAFLRNDNYRLGNLLKQGLNEILSSPLARFLRYDIEMLEPKGKCRDCPLFKYGYCDTGCKALKLAFGLDILDPNPYCTRDIEGSPFNSLYKALIKSRWG
jgi:radical SAM protein with 4Fe4S-binding SPASM domain